MIQVQRQSVKHRTGRKVGKLLHRHDLCRGKFHLRRLGAQVNDQRGLLSAAPGQIALHGAPVALPAAEEHHSLPVLHADDAGIVGCADQIDLHNISLHPDTQPHGQHCAERRRGQIEPQPPGMPEANRQRAQHSQHKQRVPLRQTNRRKRQCGAAPYQPEQPLEPETQHEGRQVRDCRQKRHSAAHQQQDAQLQGGLDHPDDQQVAEHPDQAGRHAVGHQHRQRGKAGKHCRLHRLCHLA